MSIQSGIQVFLRMKADNNTNKFTRQVNDKELYCFKPTQNAMFDQQRSYLFSFDWIFSEKDDNFKVYQQSVLPQIKQLMEGTNVNVLLYGQTASGKTFTMVGDRRGKDNIPTLKELQNKFSLENVQQELIHKRHNSIGLVLYSLFDIFKTINKNSSLNTFKVQFSLYEIYNDSVFDLLRNQSDLSQPLSVIEDYHTKEFYIPGLSIIDITEINQILHYLVIGETNRHYSSTVLNHCSSRSHTLFKIGVQQFDQDNNQLTDSYITFVDLAGSEKLSFSQDKEQRSLSRERNQESTNINKSLFCLARILHNKCSQKQQHIPYRDSALTKVLKSSFDQLSQTQVILFIIPSDKHLDQNLQTLRFGAKSQKIQSKLLQNIRNLDRLTETSQKTPSKGFCQTTIRSTERNHDTQLIISKIQQIIDENCFDKQEETLESLNENVGILFSSIAKNYKKQNSQAIKKLSGLLWDYEGNFYKEKLKITNEDLKEISGTLVQKQNEINSLQKQLHDALNLISQQQNTIREQQSTIERLRLKSKEIIEQKDNNQIINPQLNNSSFIFNKSSLSYDFSNLINSEMEKLNLTTPSQYAINEELIEEIQKCDYNLSKRNLTEDNFLNLPPLPPKTLSQIKVERKFALPSEKEKDKKPLLPKHKQSRPVSKVQHFLNQPYSCNYKPRSISFSDVNISQSSKKSIRVSSSQRKTLSQSHDLIHIISESKPKSQPIQQLWDKENWIENQKIDLEVQKKIIVRPTPNENRILID